MLRAGIVARVSTEKQADNSPEEQEDAGRRVCAQEKWEAVKVYRHIGSMARFARRGNAEWDALQRDIDAGQIKAVFLWESSRGSRRNTQWSMFLDRCMEHGVLLYVWTHHRVLDPRLARDWRSLAEDGVDAQYESEKISERVRRALDSAAAEGRPHGPVLYGYQHVMIDGKKARIPDSTTAEVVRSIFRDVAARVPLSTIARRTGLGRIAVRRIAENPAYAGMRRSASAGLVPAVWPALVGNPEWQAAQRVLRGVNRGHWQGDFRPGEVKYLLSGIAVCKTCSEPLVPHVIRRWKNLAGETERLADYRCRTGHVSIREATADAAIEPVAIDLLNNPRVWAHFAPASDDVVGQAKEALEALHDQMEAAADAYADGQITITDLANVRRRLEPKIQAAQQHYDDLAAGSDLPSWPNLEHWYGQELAARRHMIRALFERIEVGTRYDSPRVRYTLRELG
jgi:site-specific DNA recombinase